MIFSDAEQAAFLRDELRPLAGLPMVDAEQQIGVARGREVVPRALAVNATLLAPLLEGPDAVANFRRLLSEPFTAAQRRQWLAERGASPAM